MSATLRYDISRELATAVTEYDMLLLAVFGGKDCQRWAGVRNGWRDAYTFAIKLPDDVGNAAELLEACGVVQDDPLRGRTVKNSAHGLAAKVIVSLGLPHDFWPDIEDGFINAIAEKPGELTNWSAYADWLRERDSPTSVLRGEIMAAWLGKKAVKTKYGIPLAAREPGYNAAEVPSWRTLTPIFEQDMGPRVSKALRGGT